jgi:hypothetical protein
MPRTSSLALLLMLIAPLARSGPIPDSVRMSTMEICASHACWNDVVELDSGGPGIVFEMVVANNLNPSDDPLLVSFTVRYDQGWIEVDVDQRHTGVTSPFGLMFFMPTGPSVEDPFHPVNAIGQIAGWDYGIPGIYVVPSDPERPLRMWLAVPEPATTALMLAGLGLVSCAAWRRRSASTQP